MKRIFNTRLLILILLASISHQYYGCKKIDLQREVSLSAGQVSDTTFHSAVLLGETLDAGEQGKVTEYGFAYAISVNPSIDDNKKPVGSQLQVGDFSALIDALESNTTYYFRLYLIQSDGKILYGIVYSFKTLLDPDATTPDSEWLHYDTGENHDGIGLTNGGSFDVAIRFDTQQLSLYNGFKITRIQFFPTVGSPVQYTLEIFNGENPTLDDLVYEQLVESPQINLWNDILLSEPYIIDAAQELWVGYFIENQEPSTYPAGIDAGPGETGYGDLISVDNLSSWVKLSDIEIDASWNLQIFVTNDEGVEIPFKVQPPRKTNRKPATNNSFGISSFNKSGN